MFRVKRAADALHTVTGDMKWSEVSRRLLGGLPMSFAERKAATQGDARYVALTKAERRVYHLVQEGLTQAEMAGRLGVTTTTIAKQVVSVRKKFGARTMRALMVAK